MYKTYNKLVVPNGEPPDGWLSLNMASPKGVATAPEEREKNPAYKLLKLFHNKGYLFGAPRYRRDVVQASNEFFAMRKPVYTVRVRSGGVGSAEEDSPQMLDIASLFDEDDDDGAAGSGEPVAPAPGSGSQGSSSSSSVVFSSPAKGSSAGTSSDVSSSPARNSSTRSAANKSSSPAASQELSSPAKRGKTTKAKQ